MSSATANKTFKVLIGTDGSQSCFSALEDLQHAGIPPVADALIMAIGEVSLPVPSSFGMIETSFADKSLSYDMETARAWSRAAATLIGHYFPKWDVRTEIRLGSPAREIILEADGWKPDLIVVGSHGRSALGRFFFGSVSQKVVSEAHCSVRVGRKTGRVPNKIPRLIVGVDGFPASQPIINQIIRRKWPANAEIKLVTAIGPYVFYAGDPMGVPGAIGFEAQAEIRRQEMDEAKRVQQLYLDELAAAGLTATGDIIEGDAKRVLLEEAERWHADCIFLGTRGFSGVTRFLLGSVSSAVVARAHCSVEIVRTQPPA